MGEWRQKCELDFEFSFTYCFALQIWDLVVKVKEEMLMRVISSLFLR